MVAIHYNATLEDGTVVGDSFESKIPLKLKIGGEASIRGIELAIAGMKYGEKVRLDVSPEYGFGEMDNHYGFHGYGVRIPPRSKLIFELHLQPLDIAGPRTTKQWLEQAETNKNEGNKAFLAKDDEAAKVEYEKVIKILDNVKVQLLGNPKIEGKSEEEKEKILKERVENEEKFKSLYIASHSNMAALKLRTKHHDEAKEHCRLVLDKDPKNSKALYRLALAYKETGQLELAIENLTIANGIQDSKDIKSELSICRQMRSEQLKREKDSFGGMFDKLQGKGLYEGVKPAKPGTWKCHYCGETMSEVQMARHLIKFHSGNEKPKYSKKDMGLPDQIPIDINKLKEMPGMKDVDLDAILKTGNTKDLPNLKELLKETNIPLEDDDD
uniref:peptidylprolyl isomerase n=1 Tax=Arcella intermedia TaxID=1963864 RepID=A0A6B2L5X5_9EUKA